VDLMPIFVPKGFANETNPIKSSLTEMPTVDSAESVETEQQPSKSILLKITQSEAISPPAAASESKPQKDKPPKSEVPKGDLAKDKPAKDEPASSEAPTKKPAKGEVTKSDSKNKNWRFLFITMITLVVLTLGVGASRLIFQQKTEIFKSPSKIPTLTTEQIDKAIESRVRLDNKVTLAYLRSKLSVAQFQSQDRKYTVFRIITPETCGKLGCLYIVKPDREGMSISLQLEDIGVGKEMFKPSPKFHCFNVVQRQNDEDRNFEICEQGY
jgi:hypothetical protein